MSARALRWIHASDFHLNCPMAGMMSVPEPLRELLLEAPYRAARGVFAAAIAHDADFVLLVGGLLDPRSAPPSAGSFLDSQFRLLQERSIPVVWVAGGSDTSHGSPPWPLPANVCFLDGELNTEWRLPLADKSTSETAPAVVVRTGGPLRKVAARKGRPVADAAAAELLIHAMHVGSEVEPAEMPAAVHYLALGGRPNRADVVRLAAAAHFPGTPQGRAPSEAGPHGCTLVEMSVTGPPRLHFVPTDAARWTVLRAEWREGQTLTELKAALASQLQRMAADSADPALLVQVIVAGPIASRLYLDDGRASTELLVSLQRGLSADSRVWPACLELEVPPFDDSLDEGGSLLRDLKELLRGVPQDESFWAEAYRSELEGLSEPLRHLLTLKINGAGGGRQLAERAGRLLAQLLEPAHNSKEQTP